MSRAYVMSLVMSLAYVYLFTLCIQPIADRVAQHLEILFKNFPCNTRRTRIRMGFIIYYLVLIVNPMGRIWVRWKSFRNNLEMLCHPICNWLYILWTYAMNLRVPLHFMYIYYQPISWAYMYEFTLCMNTMSLCHEPTCTSSLYVYISWTYVMSLHVRVHFMYIMILCHEPTCTCWLYEYVLYAYVMSLCVRVHFIYIYYVPMSWASVYLFTWCVCIMSLCHEPMCTYWVCVYAFECVHARNPQCTRVCLCWNMRMYV